MRRKITAFLLHTQLFVTKNATDFCKNVTKNRLFSCVVQKKAIPLSSISPINDFVALQLVWLSGNLLSPPQTNYSVFALGTPIINYYFMKNTENDFSGLIRFVEQKDLVLEKEVCGFTRKGVDISFPYVIIFFVPARLRHRPIRHA